jgi:hypothetical protein
MRNNVTKLNIAVNRAVQKDAFDAAAAGVCVIPVAEDGSKAPWPWDGSQENRPHARSWKLYQTRRPDPALLTRWFGDLGRTGLGMVTGAVSGNTETWDFDDRPTYEAFVELARASGLGHVVDRIESGYCDDTAGGGVRWPVRYPEGVEREPGERIILAKRPKRPEEMRRKKDKTKVLIEMPAFSIMAPTNGKVHPTGKTYTRRSGGFATIASYTIEERHALIEIARSFDEMEREPAEPKQRKTRTGNEPAGARPGDEYAADVHWADVLAGWRKAYTKAGVSYWVRPGKKYGISATTGYGGSDLLYVFTSSSEFDSDKAYSKFAAYAVINHGGDFGKAAKALREKGYGSKRVKDAADRAERTSRGEKETKPKAPIDHAEPKYRGENGCIEWWNKGEWTKLANFTARITKQVEIGDGDEEEREFEITAELAGREYKFSIPAREFSSLNWVLTKLGASAIVEPGHGTAKRLVVAIQTLSGVVPGIKVYIHTGWVKIGGGSTYLHAGGAIGQLGPLKNINVELPKEIALFILPDPSDTEKVKAGVRSSLALLDLAPDGISVNMLGATYRSVLGGADMSSALIGPTGNFKTAYVLLLMAHFGAGFDSKHIPANWSNTANHLEELAYIVKDAPLLIDEFMPGQVTFDRLAYQSKAERVLRNQGNVGGRGRMNKDRKLAPAHPPRGLILLTGEEVPDGESLRARMATSELRPNAINAVKLAAAQREAAAGTYAMAMAGFIKWLAPQLEAKQAQFQEHVKTHRERARTADHKRTADVMAQLMAAWGVWLDFAVEVGAVTEEAAAEIADRVWKTLLDLGSEQSALQEESNPVAKFRDLILAALQGGRVHLRSMANEMDVPPPNATSWGWVERTTDRGEVITITNGQHIGWADEERLYLIPALTFKAVSDLSGVGGFGTGRNKLSRELVNEGVVLRTEKRSGKRHYDWRLTLPGGERIAVWVTTHTLECAQKSGPSSPSVPEVRKK